MNGSIEDLKLETSPEEIDMILQRRNYNLMNKEMIRLLSNESMGGNAGSIQIEGKNYSCSGANLYVDSETGEIVVFGNSQDLDPKLMEGKNLVTFKVAFDLKTSFHNGFFRIVKTYGLENLSPQARVMIESCVEQYNEVDVKKVRKIA